MSAPKLNVLRRIYTILPEHDRWLRQEAQRRNISQSALLRSLIPVKARKPRQPKTVNPVTSLES